MSDFILVRFFAILYLGIALLIFYILYRNAAAPDALKNVGILLASLLPVLVITLPYLIKQEKKTDFYYSLIYDSENKKLTIGQDYSNPYARAYSYVFTNVPSSYLEAENFGEFMGNAGLDLIEKGIVEKLLIEMANYREGAPVPSITPVYIATKYQFSSRPAQIIKIDELLKHFTHNPIIQSPGVIVGTQLSLPPRSLFSTKRVVRSNINDSRIIYITNRTAKTKIEISAVSGLVAQSGVLGVLEPDPKNMNRFYVINYEVSLTVESGTFRSYSPEMSKYTSWVENLLRVLGEMDWQTIQNKIEKDIAKRAYEKIIKQ